MTHLPMSFWQGLQKQVQVSFCGTGLKFNHQGVGDSCNSHTAITQVDTSWLTANLSFIVEVLMMNITEEITSLVPLKDTTND